MVSKSTRLEEPSLLTCYYQPPRGPRHHSKIQKYEQGKICLKLFVLSNANMLKPSQNKKGQKNSRCTVFGVFFYSWQLRKRHRKRRTWLFFWPFVSSNSFIIVFKKNSFSNATSYKPWYPSQQGWKSHPM